MFRALKKRDNWEDALNGQEQRLKTNELTKHRLKKVFADDLESYRKWLLEVDLEGVKYK